MTFDLIKKIGAGALAAALTLGVAQAQDFGAWDGDSNGDISESEFNTGFGETGGYGEWDANSDGMLDENEFNTGLYNAYDENEDGVWSEDEYDAYEEDDWF